MTLFSIALTFFLVANPIGNSPAIVAVIKDFTFEQQKKIMRREALIAFTIAIFFQFFGEIFLNMIGVKDYSLSLCGGLLLFLLALNMIFSSPEEDENTMKTKQEPFIVPIATPLVTGPGLMAIIMIYSKSEKNDLLIFSAICLAWVGITAVLMAAPYLKKIMGKKGLFALAQLMGMILALISMQLIVKGLCLFLKCQGYLQ